MGLPFLREKDGFAQGPVETQVRTPDDGEGYDHLDALADDILAAIEKKDRRMLRSALEALCELVREESGQDDVG